MRVFIPIKILFLVFVSCCHAQSCLNLIRSQYPNLSRTTGNVGLDQAFNRQLNLVSQEFGVPPGFLMVDASAPANAQAYNCGVIPGTSATVVFGMRLTAEEFARTGPNNYTIPAIIPHEFILFVKGARGTDLPGTGKELQADFMAGW